MNVEVIAASRDHQALIRQLIGPYLKELHGVDATTEYKHLSFYWTEAGRFPFLIRADGEVAGFALIRRIDNPGSTVMEVAEFYVRPEYRWQGIGKTAAIQLWKQFPGSWKLEVIKENLDGAAFWRKCLEDYAPDCRDAGFSRDRLEFRFEVRES